MAKRRSKSQSPSSSLRKELANLLIAASYKGLLDVAGEFSERAVAWKDDEIPLIDNENWAMFLYTWAEMVLDEE